MPDLQWGIPVTGGEIAPNNEFAWLYKVSEDGTRRIEPHFINFLGAWTTGIGLAKGTTVEDQYAGYIPARGKPLGVSHLDLHLYDQTITAEEGEAGRYVHFADPDKHDTCDFTDDTNPPTPGTDYYKFRKILGEHALRYLDENPISAIRLADPDQTRIHTVNHELTTSERTQASNNDSQIRGTIGHLWLQNEILRVRTADATRSWIPDRDAIAAQLKPFCDLCEGAGLSYRTINKHPHNDWEKWQLAGLRFSVDRDFIPTVQWESGIITPEVHREDLLNFRHALDFAAEGHTDDDYNMPLFGNKSSFTTRRRSSVQMPRIADADLNDNITRSYLLAGWRNVFDMLRTTPPDDHHEDALKNWCVLNVLAVLDERNFTNQDIVGALERNLKFTRTELHTGWSHNFNTNYTTTSAVNAEFPRFFWAVLPGLQSIENRTDVYITDQNHPHSEPHATDTAWVDTAERTDRLINVANCLGTLLDLRPGS